MSDFDEFWAGYPRKVGRADAKINFNEAMKGSLPRQRKLRERPPTFQEIMEGLEHYKGNKPGWQDWLHPATFLSKLRWTDRYENAETMADRNTTQSIEMMRRDHESGRMMYPSLALLHGWAEYGSVTGKPKLEVVV